MKSHAEQFPCMHLNSALDSSNTVAYFEYIKDYVNVWCPHTFFYTSFANCSANRSLTYRYAAMLEKNLGTFKQRMANAQSKGDEIYWYVTRFPETPEITLTIDTPAVNYRIMFWQQKMYRVDGFLYYCVNDWNNVDPRSANYGWEAKHEISSDGMTPYDVYGNGTLVYYERYKEGQYKGAFKDYAGECVNTGYPVGSLRLECVRDGIEDFEYLTIMTELYGADTVDWIIKQITTSLGDFESDEVLFTKLRVALGNLIVAKN